MINRIVKTPKKLVFFLIGVLIIAAVMIVCSFTGSEKRAFENWLHERNPEEIYTQARYEKDAEARVYSLQTEEEAMLHSILEEVRKSSIRKGKTAGSKTDYLLYMSDWDEADVHHKYTFHVMDEDTLYLSFDSETAESFCKPGQTWYIESGDLAGFIMQMADEKGERVQADSEVARADVDKDGEAERISVQERMKDVFQLTIWDEDGTVIWEEEMGLAHVGWGCVLLHNNGAEQSLMHYSPWVGQGMAGYSYEVFHINEMEKILLDEGSADFEYYADEPFTSDTIDFMNSVNGYLEDSVILLSTLNGETVIGPVSTQKLIDENQNLLDHRTYTGLPVTDMIQVMERAEPSQILRMDFPGNITEYRLTEAMKGAVPHQISYDEAVSWGYSIYPNYYELGTIYMKPDEQLWNSSEELRVTMMCGLTEDVVEVRYGKLNKYHSVYFKDADLYHLVRHYRDYDAQVDEGAYGQYKDILTGVMEANLAAMADNPGQFTEYELKRFHKIWEYEEEDGSRVELYDFDFSLIPEHVDRVGWAGGMYLDSDGNVQGIGPGQFAVRYRDGVKTVHHFMGSDFDFNPAADVDPEAVSWAKSMIAGALDYAE